MNNSTIYIIGTGAIGKALAVFLKLADKQVILIRGSVDNQPSSVEKFQVELGDKTVLEASIEVSTLSQYKKLNGIIVLTNKSFGNENLSQALKGKTDKSPIVLLQNGLGVEQSFIDNNFPEIYRCVLFATSQTTSQNTLRFKPVSISQVGTIQGTGNDLNNIIGQLNTPNFPFKAVDDIQTVIWKKAIANSVFNSVCPLLEIDNGIFHRNETALAIARRVVTECVEIATAMGIALRVDEVVDSLVMISKASDGQLISTLQDIKSKRETEIETLNFSIVNMAKKLNKEAAVAETKLLGELTRLKSQLNR